MSNFPSPASTSYSAFNQPHKRRRAPNRLHEQGSEHPLQDSLLLNDNHIKAAKRDISAQHNLFAASSLSSSQQQQQQQQQQKEDEQDHQARIRRTEERQRQQQPFLQDPSTETYILYPSFFQTPSIPLSLQPAPTATFLPPESDEDEDVTWLVVLIISLALIIPFASVIRSCSQKAGWLTGSSSSSSASSPSVLPGGGWSNGYDSRRNAAHRGRGFGRGGYSGTGPLPVPEWEVDPAETEERLAALTDSERQAYDAAKAFQVAHPPNSVPTEISLSQYLSIQEKGVSAWEFEASYDQQIIVHDRTELSFFDRIVSVQTNLPLPKQQEVYYWEVKMFEKSPNTTIAIGVSTKPYPSTRLPGWNRHSVGYFSNNGKKFCNSPWNAHHYGPPFHEADVVGCGYRPRNGTIFFTRNGKRIEDAYTGFGRTNLFPTVGATGPCVLHVNFGQSGFVFVEANVKKWGLAPASGSLAPPPAYGSEVGSILLEASGSATEAQGALSYMRGSTARGQARPILQSSASRTTIQGMPRQGQRGELRNNRTPGDVEHGVSATAPMEISLSNTSAPPPKYSSLDCNGNPSGNYGQGTRSDNLDGRQHADQHDVGGGADTEDEDEDAASVQSDSSDESVTVLLGET